MRHPNFLTSPKPFRLRMTFIGREMNRLQWADGEGSCILRRQLKALLTQKRLWHSETIFQQLFSLLLLCPENVAEKGGRSLSHSIMKKTFFKTQKFSFTKLSASARMAIFENRCMNFPESTWKYLLLDMECQPFFDRFKLLKALLGLLTPITFRTVQTFFGVRQDP